MQNQNLPQTTEFDHLLQLQKIEPQHLQNLSPEKQREFRAMLSDILAAYTGDERDAFLEKIGHIIDPDKIWEYNHSRITGAIEAHIKINGGLPTKAYLAEVTGLSRETIRKHLRCFNQDRANEEQTEMQSLMTKHVLSKVMQCALNGNMQAARIYLDSFKKEEKPAANDITINNQNNYVQINGTVLNQQTIQQLNADQLKQIEQIITRNTPEKKAP